MSEERKGMSNLDEIVSRKISGVGLIEVSYGNPNGSPDGNEPRQHSDGRGYINGGCLNRKTRNRMQDMKENVLIQLNSRGDDGQGDNIQDRLAIGLDKDGYTKKSTPHEISEMIKNRWIDARLFGGVFSVSSSKSHSIPASCDKTRAVSITDAISVSPILVEEKPITKCTNGTNQKTGEKSSDTMGSQQRVEYGIYKFYFTVDVLYAEKSGLTNRDVEKLKRCLLTMFIHDQSGARPPLSMRMLNLYWFVHSCPNGQYSDTKIYDSVKVKKIVDGNPTSVNDYEISFDKSRIPNIESHEYEEIDNVDELMNRPLDQPF